MSLVPHLFGDALDDLVRLRRQTGSIFDQNFGLGVFNDELMNPFSTTVPLLSGYFRPWRHQAMRHSGVSHIQNDKDAFKVNLDVQQFKPEEIKVKMVDNCVVVEGKHEERQDEHGFISRHFERKYKLPEDVDLDSVATKLSSDGILTIEAPKKALPPPPANEKILNVSYTNAPAVTGKSSGNGDKMEQ